MPSYAYKFKQKYLRIHATTWQIDKNVLIQAWNW
jgi:hypothetical protein